MRYCETSDARGTFQTTHVLLSRPKEIRRRPGARDRADLWSLSGGGGREFHERAFFVQCRTPSGQRCRRVGHATRRCDRRWSRRRVDPRASIEPVIGSRASARSAARISDGVLARRRTSRAGIRGRNRAKSRRRFDHQCRSTVPHTRNNGITIDAGSVPGRGTRRPIRFTTCRFRDSNHCCFRGVRHTA